MAVEVKWFPTLAKRTKSRLAQQTVDWREGLTAEAILAGEGFAGADAEAVMPIINGAQGDLTDPLRDGDSVEFLVSIQGGALEGIGRRA